MERLESITWPQPLAELLDICYADVPRTPPVGRRRPVAEVDPARDAGGRRHVRHVRAALPAGAQRGSGAALPDRCVAHARSLVARRRVHADARGRRRMARRADPRHRRDPARRVDAPGRRGRCTTTCARGAASPRAGPPAAWRTAVRTAAFGWVELLAARSYATLADRSGWSEEQLAEAMAPYWAEYDAIVTDADARSAAQFTLVEEPDRWVDHPAARRSRRRRRVALRRRGRPRAGRAEKRAHRCSSWSPSARSDRLPDVTLFRGTSRFCGTSGADAAGGR